MKRWVSVVCLVLIAATASAANPEKTSPASAATGTKSGAVLEISTLLREDGKVKGPIRIEGVVSKVFPKEQRLGLIDAAEFKKCGVVTCADFVLPVRWGGAMPQVKSLVQLEGEIRESGGKLEFVATSLQKMPAP